MKHRPHRETFREKGLTPHQQVDSLSERGLVMGDAHQARRHLEHINYHRLLPYWEGLLGSNGRFCEGATFESVLRR